MAKKTFPFHCEWCGKIKEATINEPDINSSRLTPLSEEEIVEKMSHLGTNPHYICADCLKRILGEATDA